MIDAVGTLSVQASALRTYSQGGAAVSAAQGVPSSAEGFVSSRIRVDNLLDMAILEVRSGSSGDVIRQYPSESQIRAFQRASELAARHDESQVKQARAEALLQKAQEQMAPQETSNGQQTSASAAPSIQVVAPAPSAVSAATPAPSTYKAPASTGSSFSGASAADASSSQSITV